MAVSNMKIGNPLFSGNLKVQGQPMEVDTNGLHYGFIVDKGQNIPFGVVVQKGTSDNLVKVGVSDTATDNYGIACFSDAIATNRPAMQAYYEGMPIDVMLDGYLWFYPESMAGITRASKAIATKATGAIAFKDSASATEAELTWAKIVLIDENKKRVLVRVDVTRA